MDCRLASKPSLLSRHLCFHQSQTRCSVSPFFLLLCNHFSVDLQRKVRVKNRTPLNLPLSRSGGINENLWNLVTFQSRLRVNSGIWSAAMLCYSILIQNLLFLSLGATCFLGYTFLLSGCFFDKRISLHFSIFYSFIRNRGGRFLTQSSKSKLQLLGILLS